jgi:hypothetical protein
VCPLKLEGCDLYFRTLSDDSSEVWLQKTDAGPQTRWDAVQRDAAGNESGTPEEMPAVRAVWFQGVVNGKHRCRPVAGHLIAAPRISLASQKRFR